MCTAAGCQVLYSLRAGRCTSAQEGWLQPLLNRREADTGKQSVQIPFASLEELDLSQ